MIRCLCSILLLSFSVSSSLAQTFTISGYVKESSGKAIEGATVFIETPSTITTTNMQGFYSLKLSKGSYLLEAFSQEKESESKRIEVYSDLTVNFQLGDFQGVLDEVAVIEQRTQTNGMSRLKSVDGFGIYEAKKNELILLDDFAANKVTNNARQIFAKVPGLNIWESDFSGLQLDIAARGLGPSRTANFNTRQNGYDMSADALGYPESYYTPPIQAVEEIEIVRGAASLQYGTQFGGMLNFRIKQASEKPFELNYEQAVGSFGFLNSFVSVGGTKKSIDYYGYYQYKQGDGWRQNSGFYSHLGFTRIGYRPNERLKLGLEYSFMNYQAQQPGGLTDADFNAGDLKKSNRRRNWFQVSWNLLANTIDYRFSSRTKLNVRNFALFSSRDALGNLEQIDRFDDPNSPRTLISDQFKNFGSELRLLHNYQFLNNRSAILIGGRYYNGFTDRKQGSANSEIGPDFSFLDPDDIGDFDSDFPSRNYSLFAENIFNVTDKLSVTPGIRFEYIQSEIKGKWKQTITDFADNPIVVNELIDDRSLARTDLLLGLGISYYLNDDLNLYTNFSENYRPITFSDLRLNNPNFRLDSLIMDENGFNLDLGIRGELGKWISADISLFYLRYNDRIGILLPEGSTTLLRTNVGDSRHVGLESFVEFDILEMLRHNSDQTSLSLFSNLSIIDAIYVDSENSSIKGREVEYVPDIMLRTGLNYGWKGWKATYQVSYLSDQFSDATNSVFNPNALTGIIPSYYVMDLSFEYKWQRFKSTFGINNLTNQKYFTRRAESYPGPGIIPATIRSFYFSIGVTL